MHIFMHFGLYRLQHSWLFRQVYNRLMIDLQVKPVADFPKSRLIQSAADYTTFRRAAFVDIIVSHRSASDETNGYGETSVSYSRNLVAEKSLHLSLGSHNTPSYRYEMDFLKFLNVSRKPSNSNLR